MKPLTPFITLLLTLTPLGQVALAVNTNPLGAMVVSVASNADQKFGIPFLRAPSFVGATDSVSSGTVTVTGTVGDVTTEAHYLTVTSGTLEGSWYEVTGSTASSVTVAEDLQTEGLLAGDSLIVRPFWTLGTLFPNGGDVPQSSNVFDPVAFVFTTNPSVGGINQAADGVFFYHDGTQGAAGWYSNGDFTPSEDVILSPEAPISVRNLSGSPASIILSGAVPESSVSNTVVSSSANRRDNRILNPFPVALTLANSDLIADGAVRPSPNPFDPLDFLFVFSSSSTVKNPSATGVYFYHDGSQGAAGWYSNGDFTPSDNYQLSPGMAITVRRGQGSDEAIEWKPATPYTL